MRNVVKGKGSSGVWTKEKQALFPPPSQHLRVVIDVEHEHLQLLGIDRQCAIKDCQRLFIFLVTLIEIHTAHSFIDIEVERIKAKALFECLKSTLLTI